jgi:DNA-binding response OmpR family regulator
MLQEEAHAMLWPTVKSRPRVLFVEPDPSFGRSLLRELDEADVVVEWIRTADELRARCAGRDACPPKLVFLDWELPGAQRGEPLRLIQEMFPLAAVVVLSRALTGDSEALLLCRGIPSIQKPLEAVTLSQLVIGLSSDARRDPTRYWNARQSALSPRPRASDRGAHPRP